MCHYASKEEEGIHTVHNFKTLHCAMTSRGSKPHCAIAAARVPSLVLCVWPCSMAASKPRKDLTLKEKFDLIAGKESKSESSPYFMVVVRHKFTHQHKFTFELELVAIGVSARGRGQFQQCCLYQLNIQSAGKSQLLLLQKVWQAAQAQT